MNVWEEEEEGALPLRMKRRGGGGGGWLQGGSIDIEDKGKDSFKIEGLMNSAEFWEWDPYWEQLEEWLEVILIKVTTWSVILTHIFLLSTHSHGREKRKEENSEDLARFKNS